jgi:hypothetical protein
MIEGFEVQAGADKQLGELRLDTVCELVQLVVTDTEDKPIPMYMVYREGIRHPDYGKLI